MLSLSLSVWKSVLPATIAIYGTSSHLHTVSDLLLYSGDPLLSILDYTRNICWHPLLPKVLEEVVTGVAKLETSSKYFLVLTSYKWLSKNLHQDIIKRVLGIPLWYLTLLQSLHMGSSTRHVVLSQMTSGLTILQPSLQLWQDHQHPLKCGLSF